VLREHHNARNGRLSDNREDSAEQDVALPAARTAKATKGDREKCLEAGALDYLAKPANTEQLMSALRMCCIARRDWL
jgi:CheY-like chemotaxis protein